MDARDKGGVPSSPSNYSSRYDSRPPVQRNNQDPHSFRGQMAVRHHKETLDAFTKLLGHKESSDVVFVVGNDFRVHAHRCVLAVRSPAFQAMLFGPMKEAQTKEVHSKFRKLLIIFTG